MAARPSARPPIACPRTVAVQVLTRVLGAGQALDDALAKVGLVALTPRDRALVKELCFGTLRWYWRLHGLLLGLMKKPLKAKDRDLEATLLIGLYQLLYTRIPAHAAIHATVKLTATLNKAWARGLVNGILRRVQREHETLEATLERDPVTRYAHPRWLVSALREAWPEDWQAILVANNQRPPMTLRCNLHQGSREQWAADLTATDIASHAAAHTATGLTLETPQATEQLSGFADGRGSVQDAAAQLCAPLLDLAPGQRVLDACAAPGGKTGHLLESEPDLAELVALDRVSARLQPLRDNLRRLRLEATVIDGDALKPATWWDGRPFDRILLDAPCSGTGVVRRHPDIKVLRRSEDIEAMADRQYQLLLALWPLLAHTGILLYVTCSILPTENDQVVNRFLAATPDAELRPVNAAWGRQCAVGRQILPGEQNMDGFYFARLIKPA